MCSITFGRLAQLLGHRIWLRVEPQREINSYKQKATQESSSQMTLQAVGDEDYALVATIQGARHAGANDSFLIGRNEPAVQHYRRSIANICGT